MIRYMMTNHSEEVNTLRDRENILEENTSELMQTWINRYLISTFHPLSFFSPPSFLLFFIIIAEYSDDITLEVSKATTLTAVGSSHCNSVDVSNLYLILLFFYFVMRF